MTVEQMKQLIEASRELPTMPEYKCHKVVKALKIEAIAQVEVTIDVIDAILEEFKSEEIVAAVLYSGDKRIPVNVIYMNKHKPEVGGYFVVYDDGYKSWSPAKAFEDGYTLIQ